MKIWICNTCHAEIPAEGEFKTEPKSCPLCNSGKKGFYEDEREDKNKDPEEKRTSEAIKKAQEELEKYEEGCEPKSVKYNCEC